MGIPKNVRSASLCFVEREDGPSGSAVVPEALAVTEGYRIVVETTLENAEGEQEALDWDFELERQERKEGGMAEAISGSFSYCM